MAETMRLLNNYNLLGELTFAEQAHVKRRITECILATDMGQHMVTLKSMQELIDNKEAVTDSFENQ